MKKQLPYIAFEGVGKTKEEVLDSLIALEPLFIMMGYNKPYEEWNNEYCEIIQGAWQYSILHLTDDGKLEYHNHSTHAQLFFKTTEIKEFINYMIKEGYLK